MSGWETRVMAQARGGARAVPGLLRRIRTLLRNPSALQPGSRAPSREVARLIAASQLFDRAFYLSRYLDVAAAGVDPVIHFLLHGAAERRDPSASFDTAFYLAEYPDVAASGMNPLVHFLLHGAAEGRRCTRGPAAEPAASALVRESARPAEEATQPPPRTQDAPATYSSTALAEFLAGVPGIHGGGAITWGLSEDTLKYIDGMVGRDARTLETGAGVSTLLFAFKGAAHTCITPFPDEVERLKRYCHERQVSTDRVTFIVEKSQDALPRLQGSGDLDLVLVDGGHGFPVPFLDWFLTAPRLKVDGLVIVDDTQLWTGEVLRDFLLEEPEWALDARFVRGAAFRKRAHAVDKEWNQQPYVFARSDSPGRPRDAGTGGRR